MHHSEDALLHLSSVGTAQDDLLLRGEVDVYCVLAFDVRDLVVGAKLAGVDHGEVGSGSEVFFDLFLRSALEHVFHEQGMVGTGRNDARLQLVARVPARVLVDNKDTLAHVQEVDSARSVHCEGIR